MSRTATLDNGGDLIIALLSGSIASQVRSELLAGVAMLDGTRAVGGNVGRIIDDGM